MSSLVQSAEGALPGRPSVELGWVGMGKPSKDQGQGKEVRSKQLVQNVNITQSGKTVIFTQRAGKLRAVYQY